MCVLETVSHKLAVQAGGLQRGGSGGRPELSPSDLAAMLSGLPAGAVQLAYAKLAHDPAAARLLYAALHREAADLARAERWEVPRGSHWLRRLALLVRDDLLLPRAALGRAQAAAWMSEVLPMSERQWRQAWSGHHARLLNVGLDWECQLRRQLGRQIYGGRV